MKTDRKCETYKCLNLTDKTPSAKKSGSSVYRRFCRSCEKMYKANPCTRPRRTRKTPSEMRCKALIPVEDKRPKLPAVAPVRIDKYAGQPCWVYLIQCGESNFYKIGVATDIEQRLTNLQSANPYILTLVACFELLSRTDAYFHENTLHKMMSKNNIHLEWFSLTRKQVEQIKEYMNPDG